MLAKLGRLPVQHVNRLHGSYEMRTPESSCLRLTLWKKQACRTKTSLQALRRWRHVRPSESTSWTDEWAAMLWMISCGSRMMGSTIFQEKMGHESAGESGPRIEGDGSCEMKLFLGRSRTRTEWSQVEGFLAA